MARKSTLAISGGTKDNESSYRSFTKGYRQSDNVIDMRDGQGEKRYMQQIGEEVDGMLKMDKRMDRLPETSTRKVDAEEAVRKTHTER